MVYTQCPIGKYMVYTQCPKGVFEAVGQWVKSLTGVRISVNSAVQTIQVSLDKLCVVYMALFSGPLVWIAITAATARELDATKYSKIPTSHENADEIISWIANDLAERGLYSAKPGFKPRIIYPSDQQQELCL